MSKKIEWIKSQLLLNEDASEAASRLNSPREIDNPIPQGTIPTPIDIDKMWDLVSPAEVYKVLNTLIWDRVVKAIAIGNKALVGKYISALVAGGALTPATVVKIMPALAGNIPDPNWQARIVTTPAKLAGFDPILVDEVQSAIDQN